jgi:Asp-tRNA(Asn)/Glu-tRNA(Gln) amidotransferase C subunit
VREQLTGILEMAKGVQGAHTGALVQNAGEFRNVMREDEPKHEPGTYTERIVAQFPDREGNYLAVHQVITGGKHTESH